MTTKFMNYTDLCKISAAQTMCTKLSLSLSLSLSSHPSPAIQAREPRGKATMQMYIEVYVLWYVST